MKRKTERKIKKRAAFQTPIRLGLPDVTFRFSREGANSSII